MAGIEHSEYQQRQLRAVSLAEQLGSTALLVVGARSMTAAGIWLT